MPTSARAFFRSQVLFLGVGLLALVAIIFAAIALSTRSSDLAAEIIAARDLKTAAVEAGSAMQRAESSQRGFLYTNNEVYLAPYDLAKAEARRRAAQLLGLVESYPALDAAATKLVTVLDAKFVEMDETIRLTRAQSFEEALNLTLTNRGKALTDEANVYLTGIVLAADSRLSDRVAEQTRNAGWQRLVTLVGGIVAIAAAVAGLVTILRYANELASARDALAASNYALEERVADRTADLARSVDELSIAKERAELLLGEVNHRVANSLAMVSSLVGLQASTSKDEGTRSALTETQSRIQAIAVVHQRLYASGNVGDVALDDYLRAVLTQLQASTGIEGRIFLHYELDQLRLKTDASINLGVVATEWVMNAAKYAYPMGGGEVRVILSRLPDQHAVLAIEDDGVGRDGGPAKGTGLGSRIVSAMARSLSGHVEYLERQPGLAARLTFPLPTAT